MKENEFQTIEPVTKCFSKGGGVPIDCLVSKRLDFVPIDCLFIQEIASCLRPSDCFSIQSIALCRLWILEFNVIYCLTVRTLLYRLYIVLYLQHVVLVNKERIRNDSI